MMTEGHRHRHLTTRSGSLLHRVLHTVVARTDDRERAETSRFVWGPDTRRLYRLTVLGVLHGLTGLTMALVEDGQTANQPDPAE